MREFVSSYLYILLGIIGIALISFGTWLFSHPAGYIVAGVLTILALIDSRSLWD